MFAKVISTGIESLELIGPGICYSGVFPRLKCLNVGWFPEAGYCRIGALSSEP